VEWMLMLELHTAGRLKAIQPILIGKLQPDGTMSNFFTDGSKGNLMDAVSQKTLAKVREYAEMIRLPLSAAAAMRTIKGTLDELTTFQTTLWWDEKGGHGKPRTDLAPTKESPFHRMVAGLVFDQVRVRDAATAESELASLDPQQRADTAAQRQMDVPAQLGHVTGELDGLLAKVKDRVEAEFAQPAKSRAANRGAPSTVYAMDPQSLRSAFALFDKDGSGALSHDELVEILRLPGDSAFNAVQAGRAANKIITDFDANGDGVLQFEEFVAWWSSRGVGAGDDLGNGEAGGPSRAQAAPLITAAQETASPPAVGLRQQVQLIKAELELDASLSTPLAIKQANELMGVTAKGTLPEQAALLMQQLGI